MKVVEMLKIGVPMLNKMSDNGILLKDYEYVPVYEQFVRMRDMGIKYRETIRILSTEYNISARTLQRAIKRMEKDC